ncbi:MAG TPA: TIR-like protein FxsC [Actinocrinis sp.]|uniref:TIR-like protein FxsC n=1 Tax=Actinocrinis sp. TaxID=1920516 RepID=UPI002D3AD7D5|nr:TIR-like protein FxsC [Actinocrinis sp.]HZU58224.1 TIR-like protein FxsC [Actinocrinis sp.]
MGSSSQDAIQRRSGYGSCFFLSYAHTPRVFDDGPDPNYWVRSFFRDLCTELVHRDSRWHAPASRPGFMDDAIPDGAIWRSRLAEQLASCRVFVPLYSRTYFSRENCGKEWAVFRERQMAHLAQTGTPNEAILPVIWQPPRPEDVPQVATNVQVAQLGVSNRYLERGLYELMRLDRDGEYVSVLIRLAEYLDEAARTAAPPPGPIVDYEEIRPLFPDRPQSTRAARRLYITVAAPDLRTVPPGRDTSYYGARPEDWNPYSPQSAVPLAKRAEDVARGLGYLPVTSNLNRSSPELRRSAVNAGDRAEPAPNGPGILLVDPWIANDSLTAKNIAEFDRRRKPWIRVLIPWSATDGQTAEQSSVLRAKLQLAIPWSAEAWRRTARAATRDLASLAEFGHAMPAAVELAWRHYLKAAQPKPPQGDFPPRPRLAAALTSRLRHARDWDDARPPDEPTDDAEPTDETEL